MTRSMFLDWIFYFPFLARNLSLILCLEFPSLSLQRVLLAP